ncbi:MAG TPA: RluA family pseudouridine synthase [Kofleriaceae bacterium]|nr:RluA family pseudouridine synthase [Kofleriaceae bacterium]
MLVTPLAASLAPPSRMPSPFAVEPHPLARHAADRLRAELSGGLARELHLDEDGKMFGVLVVADAAGRLGFLRGFSGMVRGRWLLDGFVPPAFDLEARDAFWPAGECELAELGAQIVQLEREIAPLAAELAALDAAHEAELEQMREHHRIRRDHRRALRRTTDDPDRLAALAQESRADAAERKRLDARHAGARVPLEARVSPLVVRRDELDRDRATRSRDFLRRIHATYALPSARGATRSLAEIFAPHTPPGGAGDCAAPKLLAFAYRHGLRPIALAELWCGAPPATGGRLDGRFYPACRGKCGPILAHMLDGLDVEPAPVFGDAPIDPAAPATVFEDAFLAIIDKPIGLLSVPGKGVLGDSVQARLRARYPAATGPLVVHRLDLDTSGLLLVAKDLATHAALQRQFAERLIDKRYIAWLDGEVVGESGVIELPLRVDLDDRPRQIVDEIHGKPAVTEWQVLAREGGRTRVALVPRTGRSHQLRVHASHPRGLGVPIVGDRLYGRPDARLMLHAESIGFVHPHTQQPLALHSPAPF